MIISVYLHKIQAKERMESVIENIGFTIRCGGHKYITLEWNEQFIFSLYDDTMYAEEMIHQIEKRTGMNFQDIQIKGCKDDFDGLRFFNGGWKRNFWTDFPSKKEIDSYINLKKGR